MRIRRLFVTNFKNLVNCEIRPTLIHAITGCNGTGKSNLLQVLPFVSKLVAGSDADRKSLFLGYFCGTWFPSRFAEPNQVPPEERAFKLVLESELLVEGVAWIVYYELTFSPFELSAPEAGSPMKPMSIATELLTAKEVGKPGKSRIIIERLHSGATSVAYMDSRSRPTFQAQGDLSALKILEVREPATFIQDFPLVSAFREALLSTDLLHLNVAKLIDKSQPSSATPFTRTPGVVVDQFAPFALLKTIQQNEEKWTEFNGWMRELCNVDQVLIDEFQYGKGDSNDPQSERIIYSFIFLKQYGRFLQPSQLSSGHAMLFGTLIALFSFLSKNGPIFIEEPETYLHPKATVDLLQALRGKSERTTVLISTHSPVVLNALKPEEITLMDRTKDVGYFTTVHVAEISEAMDQLSRGYTSLGDMLQTNFTKT